MDEINRISKNLNDIQNNLKKTLASAGYLIGIFIGIVGFVIIIIELNLFYKIYQISKWPIIKNAGIVQNSYMEDTMDYYGYSIFVVSQTFYGQYYRTRVSFSYEVDGKRYMSTKYSYFEPWESNPIIAKVENDYFQPGTSVDIRINPNNPKEAYIENKSYNSYVKITMGIFLGLIGLYTIYRL